MVETNSKSIFHFTKSVDTLFSIVETGLRVSYCNELFFQELIDKKYENIKSPYFIKIVGDMDGQIPTRLKVPMICFCDIPLELSENHRSKYGKYGIGLTHEWAYSNGLNNINYLSRNSNLTLDYKSYKPEKINSPASLFYKYGFSDFNYNWPKYIPEDEPTKIIDNLGNIYDYKFLYLKPFGIIQRGGGMEIEENYRNENEWRYIPKNAYILRNPPLSKVSKYQDQAEKYLQSFEQYKPVYQNLHFSPEHIEHIIVPNQSDRLLLIQRLNNTRFESIINKITVL